MLIITINKTKINAINLLNTNFKNTSETFKKNMYQLHTKF